jgi:transcriptional regulator with XRE-family HTH domain
MLPKQEHLLKSLRTREHEQLRAVLTKARTDAGLTQRDLAKRMREPHSFIGKIESGERRLDVVEFVAVAKALKLDPIDLFTRFVRA